jgi:hypothetical protein
MGEEDFSTLSRVKETWGMKYRIKTREEFVKEFGVDFTDNHEVNWNSAGDMDHLHGRILTKSESNEMVLNGCLPIDDWYIQRNHVVELGDHSSLRIELFSLVEDYGMDEVVAQLLILLKEKEGK